MEEEIEKQKQEEEKRIDELIKIADEMGFRKGTRYKRTRILPDGRTIVEQETADHRAEHFITYSDERGITLHCGPSQGLIYSRGKFQVEITGFDREYAYKRIQCCNNH
jgi:hypothetical protein